ncbi:MAG: hypothetical protein KBC96_12410 [Armatimonadetes bacterium]|nr:hypothetical protein [Armatimonadota bacterium]
MSTNEYPGGPPQKKSGVPTCLKVGGIGCLVVVLICIGFGFWTYSTVMKNPALRGVFQGSQDVGRCSAQMAQINQLLVKYAADHNGQYPPALRDLCPTYTRNQAVFDCPTGKRSGVARPYQYTRPSPTAPGSTVVLTCREHVFEKGKPPTVLNILKDGKVDVRQPTPPSGRPSGPPPAVNPSPATKP